LHRPSWTTLAESAALDVMPILLLEAASRGVG
jgi:hypothetical protein